MSSMRRLLAGTSNSSCPALALALALAMARPCWASTLFVATLLDTLRQGEVVEHSACRLLLLQLMGVHPVLASLKAADARLRLQARWVAQEFRIEVPPRSAVVFAAP